MYANPGMGQDLADDSSLLMLNGARGESSLVVSMACMVHQMGKVEQCLKWFRFFDHHHHTLRVLVPARSFATVRVAGYLAY